MDYEWIKKMNVRKWIRIKKDIVKIKDEVKNNSKLDIDNIKSRISVIEFALENRDIVLLRKGDSIDLIGESWNSGINQFLSDCRKIIVKDRLISNICGREIRYICDFIDSDGSTIFTGTVSEQAIDLEAYVYDYRRPNREPFNIVDFTENKRRG